MFIKSSSISSTLILKVVSSTWKTEFIVNFFKGSKEVTVPLKTKRHAKQQYLRLAFVIYQFDVLSSCKYSGSAGRMFTTVFTYKDTTQRFALARFVEQNITKSVDGNPILLKSRPAHHLSSWLNLHFMPPTQSDRFTSRWTISIKLWRLQRVLENLSKTRRFLIWCGKQTRKNSR